MNELANPFESPQTATVSQAAAEPLRLRRTLTMLVVGVIVGTIFGIVCGGVTSAAIGFSVGVIAHDGDSTDEELDDSTMPSIAELALGGGAFGGFNGGWVGAIIGGIVGLSAGSLLRLDSPRLIRTPAILCAAAAALFGGLAGLLLNSIGATPNDGDFQYPWLLPVACAVASGFSGLVGGYSLGRSLTSIARRIRPPIDFQF